MQIIHLNITQNCSIYHKAFKSKQNLYQHMKTHNDDKPFKCNNCNKEFRRKEELKKHVYSCKKVVPNMQEENNKVLEPGKRLREEGIKLVNSCLICHKGFTRKDALIRHSQLHDNEK